jgi:ferredoxin
MTPEQLREEYEMEEMLYGRYENIDETESDTEFEDCILCSESQDVEAMKKVCGSWVCSVCVIELNQSGENIKELVQKEQIRVAEKKRRLSLEFSKINVSEMQNLIKQNCKPQTH